MLVSILEETFELEIGVVEPPSFMVGEPFSLVELNLDLLVEMMFSILNTAEAR